jgi:class I fructose-bisphosphate aldolase
MLPLTDTPITRDGKSLILAYDHGIEHGPADFTENPETMDPDTVFELGTHDAVTAMAVQKGLAEGYYPSYEDDMNLLLKVNGTTSLWMGEPDQPVNCTVDYAVELGADAIGFTIYGGSNNEVEMFEEFREVQESCRDHGIPAVMWSYPRGQGLKNDTAPKTISYATRLALEIGADMVKVKYPGSSDAMGHAVQMAGKMPVVMSGGSKVDDRSFLEQVAGAMDAGAKGLAVGRNIWQRENPVEMLDMLEAVIFEGASVDSALSRVGGD